VWEGVSRHLDLAPVELAGITVAGELNPSSYNKTRLDLADRGILVVNSWQPMELKGDARHLLRHGPPPHRKPIKLVGRLTTTNRTGKARPRAADRIGVPYLRCDPRQRSSSLSRRTPPIAIRHSTHPGEDALKIAGHAPGFLDHEIRRGGLPRTLLP
jgi:succinyl-CoA:acetate CoA-transferase